MIISRSSAVLGFALVLCATLGAGCFSAQVPPTTSDDPLTTSTTLRGIVAGDKVILEEPAGVGAGKFKAGPLWRQVLVQSFTMGQTSDAAWELGDASNTKAVTGNWQKAALRTAHPFYLPAVFDSKTRPVGDASLLWLAQEEYRELKATSGTTIDPRFVGIPEWATRMKARPQANQAFLAFTRLINEADTAKQDLPYARLDGNAVERTILVNGVETKVWVLRVRNWYGVFEVLDRADNPLVLSFTLDPKVPKERLNVSTGDGLELANLVNYRVKEIVFSGR